MREVTLSTQKGGINRLRSKGGASPETLYLLVNGYVTTAKTIRARPGLTLRHTLFTAPTIGLTSFNGQLVVFSASTPGTFAGLQTIVLPHPSNPALTLAKIHFAQPFLGRLYVVAEFSNGDVFHYWVENPAAWDDLKVYGYLSRVQPTTPNGYYYEASNLSTAPRWNPGETITVGDLRQPTVPNGFNYRAVAVAGTAPIKTSDTEPVWPTSTAPFGPTIDEYSYVGAPPTTTAPDPPTTPFPPNIGGEYDPFPPDQDPRRRGSELP